MKERKKPMSKLRQKQDEILDHKIDFVALVTVEKANPNGDPLGGNRPRTDSQNRGEISAVCLKRKLRNRLQDEGYPIFVQSQDRATDGFRSLSERAASVIADLKTQEEVIAKSCETWVDVRAFGQVFGFKTAIGGSISIRGAVSVREGCSVDPVEVREMQITKSVNGNPSEKARGSDTLGTQYKVDFGLYEVKGSINVFQAMKNGLTYGDVLAIKDALATLFENDMSSARPDGSMVVKRVYWFEHEKGKLGQYPSARVHDSIKITRKNAKKVATSFDDYEIEVEELPGLVPEIIEV